MGFCAWFLSKKTFLGFPFFTSRRSGAVSCGCPTHDGVVGCRERNENNHFEIERKLSIQGGGQLLDFFRVYNI